MVAFLSGAVLTAANLNSAFNALTFRAVTGTSDTFVLADNGGAVSYSNASPITATVPPFSSVAYANGTVIQLLNLGAGVVTVTAGVGVTLNGSSVAIAQNTGGTLIKTATNTWYFLPSSTGSGMDLITPTSVAGSGVTLSGGVVTFSAATTVSVNNCFSATYLHYLVIASAIGSTSAGGRLRLRVGSVDASGTDYRTKGINVDGSATVTGAYSLQSTAFVGAFYTTTTATRIEVFSPFATTPTQIASNCNAETSWFYESNNHALSTSYDGFTYYPASGNTTGTLRIYGLRN